jgi:hypothetical protein
MDTGRAKCGDLMLTKEGGLGAKKEVPLTAKAALGRMLSAVGSNPQRRSSHDHNLQYSG